MTRIWSTRYGPYDAVSAIGFFEHVGLSRRSGYIPRVFSLLVNGGRFLNHAISHMPNIKERLSRSGFAGRTCATITSRRCAAGPPTWSATGTGSSPSPRSGRRASFGFIWPARRLLPGSKRPDPRHRLSVSASSRPIARMCSQSRSGWSGNEARKVVVEGRLAAIECTAVMLAPERFYPPLSRHPRSRGAHDSGERRLSIDGVAGRPQPLIFQRIKP